MTHEPRRLLRYADSPVNLVGTDSVFAVHNLPHGKKPPVEADRGILEDGPRLGCELAGVVRDAALPAIVLLQEGDFVASATRAGNAIRPPPSHQILSTVGRISKVQDRVLKGLRITSHALSIGSVSICQLYCFPNLVECPTSRSLHTYRYPWAVGSSQDLPSR